MILSSAYGKKGAIENFKVEVDFTKEVLESEDNNDDTCASSSI